MFENRALRGIFGPKREEVVRDWRRLHNEELRKFYVSRNIISDKIRDDEVGSTHGRMRNVYNILVGKPEGKRPLGRPWDRWEDNIRIDLREVELQSVDWMYLAQDRDQWRALVNTVMNLRVPYKLGNILTI
jgi:hypothetical protein